MKGSPDSPVFLSLVAQVVHPQSVSIAFTGRLHFTLPAMGLNDFPIVDVTATGTLGASSSAMALVATIPDFTLGGIGDTQLIVSEAGTALASADMTVDVRGVSRALVAGIHLFWRGDSPVPQICPGTLDLRLTMALAGALSLDAECSGLALRLPTDGRLGLVSIDHLMFNTIRVGATIQRDAISFLLGTDLEVVTYSSRKLADCTDAQDAMCMRVALDTAIGFERGPPQTTTLAIAATIDGAWIEPCGLLNFAIVDPSVDLRIALPPARAEKIGWSVTMLFLKLGDWPAGLYDKDTDLAALKASSSNLLEVTSAFTYDLTDLTGNSFGIFLSISGLDLPTMILILQSAASAMNAATALAAGTVPTPLPAMPSLSIYVPSELTALTFEFTGWLSRVTDGSFTTTGGAVVPAGLSVYLASTGQAFLGMTWDFELEVKPGPARPHTAPYRTIRHYPTPPTRTPHHAQVKDLQAGAPSATFAANPLGSVSAGISLFGNVTIPTVGFVMFDGILSSSAFSLKGAVDFAPMGPNYRFSGTIDVEYDYFKLEMSATMGAFGTVAFLGGVTTAGEAYFTGSIGLSALEALTSTVKNAILGVFSFSPTYTEKAETRLNPFSITAGSVGFDSAEGSGSVSLTLLYGKKYDGTPNDQPKVLTFTVCASLEPSDMGACITSAGWRAISSVLGI